MIFKTSPVSAKMSVGLMLQTYVAATKCLPSTIRNVWVEKPHAEGAFLWPPGIPGLSYNYIIVVQAISKRRYVVDNYMSKQVKGFKGII